MQYFVALLLVVMGGLSTAGSRVSVTVVPSEALIDVPVDVRASGLPPRTPVTLQATTKDLRGRLWRSRLAFRSDGHGVVDTHSNMRIFWSMQPVGAKPASGSVLLLPDPSTAEIAVLHSARTVARTTLTRRNLAPTLTTTQVGFSQGGFVGTYYALPGAGQHPAVLQLGGSGGGHGALPAALLASDGFPSLSLAYFREPDLPPNLQNIPLEYFRTALRWLADQPGVDPNRLVVLGVSRGGEAAILLGANYPDLVHGVVACTIAPNILGGSPPGTPAWTINGKPIPYGPLPVEQINAPVLITGGGKDEIVDSTAGTKELINRARSHGRANVAGRVYPNAGHGVGCRTPNLPAPTELPVAPNTYLEIGGTSAANAQAAAASWPRLLRFLATLPK
jgi:dienelactone hydrolase